ncbi:MAG: RNA methyltransferase [Deltaproteobacteria bacterium]|nr:RNA methyltransferase [Deltaproteobacteria bacterium]MBW1924453.1 RNA methyltransferase [Deltaproteobacteria bacterium]MBW1951022.1 RNA methyltransferase [Deltaproteobacteria bacterium]MBW2008742.1 RNA methyltransferase [Deltaproteobacteria bacterium]MBW2103066.1 RNA methyltransferase [Deltaproteobacteria bacterium]
MGFYIGLVHYPVYNKHGETIASAVTTLDLHDLARLARTYEVDRCFVVTPLEDQQRLAERVKAHWTDGYGALYNPNRKEALELLTICGTLKEAKDTITLQEGRSPLVLATDASPEGVKTLGYQEARGMLERAGGVFLLFGTAWGLEARSMAEADFVLEPVRGRGEYNHLSVRAAAAIILDRLLGRDG